MTTTNPSTNAAANRATIDHVLPADLLARRDERAPR